MSVLKEEAKNIIEKLPEQATWDDLMYQLYVGKKIDVALEAASRGVFVAHEDVRKRVLKK